MRSPLVAIGLAAVFALTGCTDQPQPAPSEPEFSHITFASATCDFNGFTSLISQYFSQPTQGVVQDLKQQMAAAYAADNEATVTTVRARGFDILANIEAAVNSGTAGSPTIGSSLAHEVLECMFTPDDLPSPFPDNLLVEELTPLSAGGLGALGVRGGSTDPAGPIFARDGFSGVAPPPTSTWSAVLSERMLIYGARPDSSHLSYDWDRVRTGSTFILPGPVIGLCTTQGTTSMVEHDDSDILAWVDPDYFLTCSPPTTSLAGGGDASGWGPRALVQQLVRLVSPKPLHAAPAFGHTSSGGSLCCRSHFDVEPVSQVVLQFTQEPTNTTVGAPVTVKVKATATVDAEVQPFVNATIVLQTVTTTTKGTNVNVTGNSAVTALVNGEAIATFTESFSKTGVYKQVATVAASSLGDRTATVVLDTTAAFHVRGK